MGIFPFTCLFIGSKLLASAIEELAQFMGSFEFKPKDVLTSQTPTQGAGARIQAELNQAIPGSAQHALRPEITAAALARPALLPGASEPISPLIQMIMKMPGHLGLLNSFFEALQNLLLPHLDFLPHLDLSILGAHAQEMANATAQTMSEHVPIDLGTLPQNAHIFDGSLAHTHQMGTHLSDLELSKKAICVSGTPDLNKPIYEAGNAGAGKDGILAGPTLSDHGASNHVADVRHIFSSKLFEKTTTAQLNNATAQTSNQSIGTSNTSANNALNVSASPFAPRLNAAMNAGYNMAAPTERVLSGENVLGPSGAVSDHLGGRQIFGRDAVSTSPQAASQAVDKVSDTSASEPVVGLRAQELIMDSTGKIKPVIAHNIKHDVLSKTHIQAHGPNPIQAQSHPHQAAKIDSVKSNPFAKLASAHHPVAHTKAVASDSQAVAKADTEIVTQNTGNTYTIAQGDCLWNIAGKELGNATRWHEIYELNIDKLGTNPDLIHAGTTLQLPEAPQQELAMHVQSNPAAHVAHADLSHSHHHVTAEHHAATKAIDSTKGSLAAAPKAVSHPAQAAPVVMTHNQTLSGAGGAQAANPAVGNDKDAIVSSSLAPDLSFLTQNKR